jgi:hypothetical protein
VGREPGGQATRAQSRESLVAVTVRRRQLVGALLAVTAFLGLASVAVAVSKHVFGHGDLLGIWRMFDMNQEANVPTWFSGTLLLACAAVLGLIWAASRQGRDADARYWAGLALLFAAASADEVATIHEAVGTIHGGSVFLYLIPGAALLLSVAFAVRGFVARLSESTRRPLVWGVATWSLGAVGLEVVEALVIGSGEPRLGLSLLGTAQDLFELVGMIIILQALIGHAYRCGYRPTLRFAPS